MDVELGIRGYKVWLIEGSLRPEKGILNWDQNENQIIQGLNSSVINPINLSLGNINGFKASIGARLKLLLFTMHIEWTKSEYNIFTIGFGLNSDLGSKLIGGSLN